MFAATEGWPLGVALAAAAGPGPRSSAGAAARRSSTTWPRRFSTDSILSCSDRLLTRASSMSSTRSSRARSGLPIRSAPRSRRPAVRAADSATLCAPPAAARVPARPAGRGERSGARSTSFTCAWRAPSPRAAGLRRRSSTGWRVGTSSRRRTPSPRTASHWRHRARDGRGLARPAPRGAARPAGAAAARRSRGDGEGDFDAAVEHSRAGVAGLERDGAPEALLWAARLALTDAHVAALDLEAAAEASAAPMTRARRPGRRPPSARSLHAALLARLGVEGSDRALEAALERPSARELLGPGLAAFRAQYRDLPGGSSRRGARACGRGHRGAARPQDPYNRLAYVLAFKMAIHEARGELEAGARDLR